MIVKWLLLLAHAQADFALTGVRSKQGVKRIPTFSLFFILIFRNLKESPKPFQRLFFTTILRKSSYRLLGFIRSGGNGISLRQRELHLSTLLFFDLIYPAVTPFTGCGCPADS